MLRDIALRIEPYVFRALQPILGGRRPRYQRSLVAQKYLRGKGAEIGAFGSPCLVPFGASTTYIDRVPASYWSQFPEYAGAKIVEPDTAEKFGDNAPDAKPEPNVAGGASRLVRRSIAVHDLIENEAAHPPSAAARRFCPLHVAKIENRSNNSNRTRVG